MQAALPDVVQLTHTLAQAEKSAAEWAARYAEEAARVDELAERNAALVDQIASLTSLLTACTGAQPPLLAEASTVAALIVRPPSTAALPEAGAVPVPRWSIVRGMWHTACRVQPHQAACMPLRRQRATATNGEPELMTHGTRAAGKKHRSRSHGPTANATTAALLPPFDLPHDGYALAPPFPRVHARKAFRRSASACRHARAGHEHATAVVASSRCAPPCEISIGRFLSCAVPVPHAVRYTTEAPPYEGHTGACVCFGATSSGTRMHVHFTSNGSHGLPFVSPFRLRRLGPLQSQCTSPLPADPASRFLSRCMHTDEVMGCATSPNACRRALFRRMRFCVQATAPTAEATSQR